MKQTSIVIADDHQVVRQGLLVLLGAESDFIVIGEASDGLEAMQVVEALRPDVLVLDVVMPGLTGIEVTRRASRRSPCTKVVLLSMYDSKAYVAEALRAGAKAYVLKRSTSEELVIAIREAREDHYYLSPPLSRNAVEEYVQATRSKAVDLYELLSTREKEVLQMTAEGCTSSEIASRLFISHRTVENHRAHIMNKLGLRTHTDVVRFAIRRGLMPLDA